MQTEITYKISKQDLEAAINGAVETLTRESFLNRFEGRKLSVNAAAEVMGCHRDTIIRRATANLIPHTMEGGHMVFNLSDLLALKI